LAKLIKNRSTTGSRREGETKRGQFSGSGKKKDSTAVLEKGKVKRNQGEFSKGTKKGQKRPKGRTQKALTDLGGQPV